MLAEVLRMPWGGDRNLALWELFGGTAAGKARGIDVAMVSYHHVQIRCLNRKAAREAAHVLGKKAQVDKKDDGSYLVWRDI